MITEYLSGTETDGKLSCGFASDTGLGLSHPVSESLLPVPGAVLVLGLELEELAELEELVLGDRDFIFLDFLIFLIAFGLETYSLSESEEEGDDDKSL